LAEHKNDGFISLKEVAQRQNISKLYLEQIVSLLNSSNILKSNRGKQGGYALAKDPSQYTVGQILRITEGSIAPVACLDGEANECERAQECKTLPMWADFYKVIAGYLDGVTLQDILDRSQAPGVSNYVI
jgi:Rrf2 family protein